MLFSLFLRQSLNVKACHPGRGVCPSPVSDYVRVSTARRDLLFVLLWSTENSFTT
jgi:hypothetical protein